MYAGESGPRVGAVECQARVTGNRAGVLFIPFHYGDSDDCDGRPRAANELTITAWDPVSKQPTARATT